MLKSIEITSGNRFIALIIGQAGIGKTSLLRTIPAEDNVCVLSAESGLLCVLDLVKSGRVQGFKVEGFSDMAEAYMELQKPEMQAKYQWIFIDSLTEIAGRCVEAQKLKYPDKKDSFNLWGDYAENMTKMIKFFRDMNAYNVVFTCLDSCEKDEMNRRFYGPSMPGAALKEKLSSYFDEVFYMISVADTSAGNEGKEKRIFICQPWDKYPGKDRSGKLGVSENPNLTAIRNKILDVK